MSAVPLVVDLDGTLLCSDMLHESVMHRLRVRPLDMLRLPLWLGCGKAHLKERLAAGMNLDPALLPYNMALLDFLRREHAAGRTLVLCTAAHESLARAIADYFGIFTEVMASTATVNLTGQTKGAALAARYGEGGFDYAGNDVADLAVWAHARRAILVNASPGLTARVQRLHPVERLFIAPASPIRTIWRAFRLHQWLKNLLLFAPCVAAHRVRELAGGGGTAGFFGVWDLRVISISAQ